MKFNTPGQIGSLTTRNRIVMAPMISNLANPDGSTNESHIRYLSERAKGGAGVIITEYTYIDDMNARGSRNQLSITRDELVPKLRRLTEAIHRYGSLCFVQLVHAGGKALRDNERHQFAPTAVDYLGTLPNEMDLEDIRSTQESFIAASGRARKAGFDGVELHGAHGYLVQEFISPALNKRTDRYGGSTENRLRFVQEIIDGIRGSTETALGIRLSLYEDDPDGYPPEYGLKCAESLENIDYVHFSAGRFASPGSTASFYHRAPHIALKLPRKPDITTMVVGSIGSVNAMEKALEKSDFVSIGRGVLADPFFPAKATNMPGTIRPCIRCNQGCRSLSWGEVRCTVNPETGFEPVGTYPRFSGDIDIIGGGIKGLEAALYASKLGFKVRLYEEREQVGGQLNDIREPMMKEEFVRLVNYYISVLQLAGVEIITENRGSGSGIFCLPDVIYPHLPERSEVFVDSAIYMHHDEALIRAESSHVTMTARSLQYLDRDRAKEFRKIAESRGIVFSDFDPEVFHDSFMDPDQYDIMRAMNSGRLAVDQYVRGHYNLHL